jgi:hypothetical protein
MAPPAPWPEESDFNGVISRANGLFIFIKTLILALERCDDPEASLNATLQGSAGSGLESLYGLYSRILTAQMVHNNADFRRVIGVLLTTAPYRPLCEETIAELAGVKPFLVKKWVDALSSLLYREEEVSGVIRVRHLSISDFFVSHWDYRVNLEDANVQLGIACLKTMVDQLRFNICRLEDSRLTNADVKDLPSRIKQNISDPLQYSCIYWSNHLCFTLDNRDRQVLGGLKEFFEGLYTLFWIEVLSIMGMVPIGAPSLRRVISWVKVSLLPDMRPNMILTACRMPTRSLLRKFRMFVVSSSPSTPPSLSALPTPIFQREPSYPHNPPYQPSSAQILLSPSGCKEESCCHGRHLHWSGLDTLAASIA